MILQIKQERIKRGWKLEDVAEKMNITKQAIQQFENNQCKPSYEVLVKLENLFQLSHRKLFAPVNDVPISQEDSNTENKV